MTAQGASPQQQYLWSRGRAAGVDALWCACAVDIAGMLDATRLHRAVGDAVARHPALSAAIAGRTGEWRLDAHDSPRWTERACDVLPPIDDVVRELASPGGLCAALYTARAGTGGQGGDAAHRLVLVAPALRADEMSLHLLASEICRVYLAEAIPPPASLQFAAVADWQWTFLEDEESRGEREWWTRETAAPLRLGVERADAPGAFRLERVRWRFGDDTARALRETSTALDAPLAAVVLVAWHTLLGRASRALPRLAGLAVDGRSYEGLDQVVGVFEKCVPFHCGPIGALTARDAIRDTAGRLHAAALRQEYCPPELAAPLGYQFACWDAVPALPASDSVQFRLADVWSAADVCRLRCVVRQMDGAVHGELTYDANVFSREDVETYAASLERLCGAISRDADAVLDTVSLLSSEARAALLARSRGERPFPPTGRTAVGSEPAPDRPTPEPVRDRTLAAMFETHAREAPTRIAIVARAGTLTYGELHRRACGVAAALRAHGIGPGDVVPICIDRSPEAVVAMLGVLLAGGACSVIEPRQPRRRSRAMLATLGSSLLLTTEATAGCEDRDVPGEDDRTPRAGSGRPGGQPSADRRPPTVLYVERCGQDVDGGAARAAAASLCSVIFTSGSSGEPKGVAVEHRHVASYLDALDATFGVAGLTFASMSTLAADLGNTAVFGALCLGGTLLLPEHDLLLDAKALGAFFAANPCDCMKIVPGHAAALLAGPDARDVVPRRYLFCGGEPLPGDLVTRVRALRPGCVVVNHYGPTECTIGVIAGVASEGTAGTLPLGRSLPGNDVYVLDAAGEPALPGMPGELCIAGAQVTRGYWRDPAATAARFVADPFAPEPGRRMYRTGDLGVLGPDDRIAFLGRMDDQVKVAGFRVEPAEIAAALASHPDVADAAAFVDRSGGDVRIAAYVVPKAGRDASLAALREHVRGTLPAHMVPAMAIVDALPRNANGKLDRDAFGRLRAEAREHTCAPRSAAERAIAEVWCAALGVPAVGVDENFFDVGGHSLMLIQMHPRLQERFGPALTVLHLFEYPTVESLARFLTDAADASDAAGARERGRARARALAGRGAHRGIRS